MTDAKIPYTDDEADEAWLFVGRFGPSNSWTATNGTAARMIGRLLEERERLTAMLAARDNMIPIHNKDFDRFM
jgi:hypothetical protein